MNASTQDLIVRLYVKGLSCRQIEGFIGGRYKRECIRRNLHRIGVNVRGRNHTYLPYEKMDEKQRVLFAELLGALYGDGCLCESSETACESYLATLNYCGDEGDLESRASSITYRLFGFRPPARRTGGRIELKFRKSFARHLQRIGYPVGQKSEINPHVPFCFLNSQGEKAGFVRGFFDAEASVFKTVKVHQSVRVALSAEQRSALIDVGNAGRAGGRRCHYVPWSKAKEIVDSTHNSNLLVGVQRLLQSLDIRTRLYPIRVYLGSTGVSSIHFELRIFKSELARVQELELFSSQKKRGALGRLVGC